MDAAWRPGLGFQRSNFVLEFWIWTDVSLAASIGDNFLESMLINLIFLSWRDLLFAFVDPSAL